MITVNLEHSRCRIDYLNQAQWFIEFSDYVGQEKLIVSHEDAGLFKTQLFLWVVSQHHLRRSSRIDESFEMNYQTRVGFRRKFVLQFWSPSIAGVSVSLYNGQGTREIMFSKKDIRQVACLFAGLHTLVLTKLPDFVTEAEVQIEDKVSQQLYDVYYD